MDLRLIERTRISEDPDQPRKHLSEEALQGLADSIRQHGMLNPITVRPIGDDAYRIVTGERRWRAARMAGLEQVPCIVKQISADELLTEQLIENLQREDLAPLDKARAIDHVKSTLIQTNREIARRLGISERTVGYLLDLLALPEDIGEAIVSSPNRPSDGQITEKHARFLKQLNEAPDLQNAVVDRIRNDKLSSEETGNLVKALKKKPEQADDILSSPTDHLASFFQDAYDPSAEFLNQPESHEVRHSAHAQRVLDFLPSLAGIDVSRMSHPELRQVEDALTSLAVAVQGLLSNCREHLGE